MPKYQFLSKAWVDEARRIRDENIADAPVPPPLRMNLVVNEIEFAETDETSRAGAPDGVLHAHLDTTGGAIDLEYGHLERADVTVSTDYATSRKLLLDMDPAAVMQAFFEGRIKVQGDLARLMALQASAPTDDTRARAVIEQVRAMTAD